MCLCVGLLASPGSSARRFMDASLAGHFSARCRWDSARRRLGLSHACRRDGYWTRVYAQRLMAVGQLFSHFRFGIGGPMSQGMSELELVGLVKSFLAKPEVDAARDEALAFEEL